MLTRSSNNRVPWRYDDGFRSFITMLLPLPILGLPNWQKTLQNDTGLVTAITVLCLYISVSFVLYAVWTHVVFTRPRNASRIREYAKHQHLEHGTLLSRWSGLANTDNWALTVAFTALAGAIAGAVFGVRTGGWFLTGAVLLTAVCSWCTVAYAYALKYFRMSSAQRTFDFQFTEEPSFHDCLSLALMVSAAGAHTAASVLTREGMRAVRTHTLIAFGFNALVIAMTVSLMFTLIQNMS